METIVVPLLLTHMSPDGCHAEMETTKTERTSKKSKVTIGYSTTYLVNIHI